MKYNSFYDFLVDRGYFFDKEIIEDFLLTIKVNPFVILLGPSGVGKSILPKLFSEYLSNQFKKEEIIIHAVNSLGKSHSNKEWHLKRDAMKEILPILPFEGKYCPFTINDSFSSMGKFKLDSRFRFNDKKLIEHLIKLQTEDPSQNLDLKIKVGEKIIKYDFDVVYNLKNEFNLFKNKINNQNSGIESVIYNFFNVPENDEEKNKVRFLVFENITNIDEEYILELLNFSQKFSLKDSTNILVGNINNEDFFQDFSSDFLDVVSIIELNQLSLEKYLSTDFQEDNHYFKDLNYLEHQIIDEDIINHNIYDIKRIFTDVSYGGQNFWEILSNELLLFSNCFNKYEINISFRCVLDILKFMVCAWKYEGKQENWENWEKYLDFQIMQKLLPKIKNSITGLDILLNELLAICDENSEEHHIKYQKSYFKLKNMICYYQREEDVSFFKFSNNLFVNRMENKNESTFQHVDDVELDDSDYFVEDKWDNAGLVWDDEYFANDDVELFDLELISESISSLKGWQKLVFEAINAINEDVFSIHDLKDLEIFQIYQFEDDSLEQIIVENLNKLSEMSIIIKVGNNRYKKVFDDVI